jgi:hypothetical protein
MALQQTSPARECIANGDPTLLAVMNAEEKTAFYRQTDSCSNQGIAAGADSRK